MPELAVWRRAGPNTALAVTALSAVFGQGLIEAQEPFADDSPVKLSARFFASGCRETLCKLFVIQQFRDLDPQ